MGFAKIENGKLVVKEGDGLVDLNGPEGLLRAIFGYSTKEIQYPLPKVHSTSDLPVKSTSPEFEAWFAGFWEGDGSVVGKSLVLYQKNTPMLLDIAEDLECGHVSWTRTGMSLLGFSRQQSLSLSKILSKYLVSPKRLDQLRNHGFEGRILGCRRILPC